LRCEFPGCKQHATTSWALVPLCEEHKDVVRHETMHYYAKNITRDERGSYQQIERLTPWGRRSN
jgi:hypothetical protein